MPASPIPRIDNLIDAHCHLDYPPMVDDVGATIARANEAGVVQFVHVGCSTQSLDRAVELGRDHHEIFVAIGIHPHEATATDDTVLNRIEHLAEDTNVVAIGETGLDYFYDRSPRETQKQSLARHVELAQRNDKPLVLHIRDAHDDALAVVREARPRTEAPGMIHCFTGGPADARAWLDAGFHLSFSGIATFKTATEIREAVRCCPAHRILLETDAPYLSPEPLRGRKNEPAHMAFTCLRLARERGVDPAEFAVQTAQNTRALLGLPPPRTPQDR